MKDLIILKFNSMRKRCIFAVFLFIGISSAARNESTICVKEEALLKSCNKNCGKHQCAFHEYCDDGRCLYCSDAKCQSPPRGCELFCSKRIADGYSLTSKPGLNCTCTPSRNEMGLQIMHDYEVTLLYMYVSLSLNGVFLVGLVVGLTFYCFRKNFFKKIQNGGKGKNEINVKENCVRLIVNETDNGNSPSDLVVTGRRT